MGPGMGKALAAAVDALEEAGIRANADPGKLNPPAVYVVPVTAEPVTLTGEWEVLVDLVLVVPDAAPAQSYAALDALAESCLGVLAQADNDLLEPVNLILPGSSAPLPAYRYRTPIYTHTA
jgi:hypothetical protein